MYIYNPSIFCASGKKLEAVYNFKSIFKDSTLKLLCPKFEQMPEYKMAAPIV